MTALTLGRVEAVAKCLTEQTSGVDWAGRGAGVRLRGSDCRWEGSRWGRWTALQWVIEGGGLEVLLLFLK